MFETLAAQAGIVDQFLQFLGHLGRWAYVIIFALVFLESAAFFGFVFPGEISAVFGGFLASRGILDLYDLMGVVAAAAILGDTVGFQLGHRLGRGWLLRYGRYVWLKEEHLKRVDDFFERHGGKTVFWGRFSAFLRAMVPFMAGASGMNYFVFLLFNVLGGAIWAGIFVTLGYLLGASWKLVEGWAGPAGAVVLGLVVFAAVLVWLGRLAIRHEEQLRAWWARMLKQPVAAAVWRRMRPVLVFLQTRLTPGVYLGLQLTVGVIVVFGAAWLFFGIIQDLLAGDPLTDVDRHVADWLQAHRSPTVVAITEDVSRWAGLWATGGIALVLALVMLVWRKWYRLLLLVLAVPGGMLLTELTKAVFHVLGPMAAAASEREASYRFPSGYTSLAVLVYGLLAVWAVQFLPGWRWKVGIVLGAFFVVVLVGFSRMYLGEQYLSGVLGGAAEGVAWLAFCVAGVETLRLRPTCRPPG